MESKIKIKRRKTKVVHMGGVRVGAPYPISIQSMTNTPTKDTKRTIKQIHALEKAGCEIVRASVLNKEEALSLKNIKKNISIPLVADIHFDYRLALGAIESGCDAIRINPGNICNRKHLIDIARGARQAKIPIRIGVNSGSVRNVSGSKESIEQLMVKSALDTIKVFEKEKFYDIIVSLKASSILETISAYRRMAKLCNYPLHLGVTAAGLPEVGIIKSSIGIGCLLLNGIGDTIRVSLTSSPLKEIEVAKHLLSSLDLRNFGSTIISCPTCGRCKVNLPKIAREVERGLKSFSDSCDLKIAVMGCEVNGPGEAKEADVGVACSRGSAVLFAKGKKIKKIKLSNVSKELIRFIKNEMVK